MIIKKTTVAGRVVAVLMVFALLLAANCCVLGASADTLGKTLYVKTTKTTTPYLYYWVDGGVEAGWPGKAMTSLGDNVYSFELPVDIGELTGIIVNGSGSGNKLTGDVKDISGDCYDVDTGTWSMFDTSKIQITAFGADVDAAYVGSKVTLTAAAKGGDGNLQYKFSTKDSVISDFSAKASVIWEPKAAGSYTITVDVKDGAGETNSKTLDISVASPDDAEDPIFLSASPANGSKIKTNSSVTVSVNGAGGKVNNKVLFYKTEITDPNGNVVNRAYYQTGNKVTFQPSLKGEYTVTMYIQNNTVKNTTTTATYTYVSTDDVDTDVVTDSDTESDVISDTDENTDSEVVTDTDTDTQSDVDSDTDSQIDTDVPDTTRGDIDNSGKTELKDAYEIQTGVLAGRQFTAEEIARADVNGDGKITLKDASLIQQYMVGVIKTLG